MKKKKRAMKKRTGKKPDFDILFDAAAIEFEAEFTRSSRGRPDEMGAPREENLRKFLSNWLPAEYGVAHGYVLSMLRESSRQTDVIIFDSSRCPKFIQDKSTDRRLIPLADTYGVLEVKSTLDEVEFGDAIQKLSEFSQMSDGFLRQAFEEEFEEKEVKAMKIQPEPLYGSSRSTYGRDTDYSTYRVKIPLDKEKRTKPLRLVFAYRLGKKLSLDAIKTRLEQEECVDGVFVLDSGYVVGVNRETLERFKALREGRMTSPYEFDLDILQELLSDNSYTKGGAPSSKALLMFFYTYLLDALHRQRLAESRATDLLAVWQTSEEQED